MIEVLRAGLKASCQESNLASKVRLTKLRYGYSFAERGLQFIAAHESSTLRPDPARIKVNLGRYQPSLPRPPKRRFSIWVKRILGTVLSLLVSVWVPKWKNLQQLEGEAETIVEQVKDAAEAVEKVATVAEKVSADVADALPENAKLRDAALFVERVSEEAVKDAQIIQEVVHKVEDLKKDVEELGAMVQEPLVHINSHKKSQVKT